MLQGLKKILAAYVDPTIRSVYAILMTTMSTSAYDTCQIVADGASLLSTVGKRSAMYQARHTRDSRRKFAKDMASEGPAHKLNMEAVTITTYGEFIDEGITQEDVKAIFATVKVRVHHTRFILHCTIY